MQPSKHASWQFSIRALLAFTLATAVGLKCYSWIEWRSAFPAPDRLASLDATWLADPYSGSVVLERCPVPRSCWATLLATISGCTRMNDPPPTAVDFPIAHVLISDTDGQVYWVHVSLDRRHCVGYIFVLKNRQFLGAYHGADIDALVASLKAAAATRQPVQAVARETALEASEPLKIDSSKWEALARSRRVAGTTR
ncbi:MAG: hypothetical protein WD847_06205 [Pirellulales bacterium]